MKNKEELKNLKEEVENESRKPHELTEEDLEQVTGGRALNNSPDVAPAIIYEGQQVLSGRPAY